MKINENYNTERIELSQKKYISIGTFNLQKLIIFHEVLLS